MQTKLKIIETTYFLFAENGMNFTLNDIANEVGIKKASIYAHFPSKESLLSEVLNNEIDKYFTEIEDKSKNLEEFFNSVINYYGTSKKKLRFWKRLLFFPPSEIGSEITGRITTLSSKRFQHVKSLVLKGLPESAEKDIKAERLAILILSVIHGFLSMEIIYENCNIESRHQEEWQLIKELLKKEDYNIGT